MKSITQRGRRRQAVPDRERGVVVAVDVSKESFTYGVFHPEHASRVRQAPQTAAGFAQLGSLLEELAHQGQEVWVGFEPTGPYSTCLREWLLEQPVRLRQVNPYHVKRTKEVRDSSPEKSDQKDPGVIADLLWQGSSQAVRPLRGVYAELREGSVEWESLAQLHTALGNIFQAHLVVWFPELCGIFKDQLCLSVRGLVSRYESVQQLARAGVRGVRATLRRVSRGVTQGRAQAVWEAARESVASPWGVVGRHRAMQALVVLLGQIEARQAQLRAELEAGLRELPEAALLRSIPEVKEVTAAGLLGECGPNSDYGSARQLLKQVGLNLYTCQSGKYKGRTRIAKRGRSRARSLLCQLAGRLCKGGGPYYEFAQRLRAKGKCGKEVHVAVARKLVGVIYAMLRDGCGYRAECSTEAGVEDGLVIHAGTPSVTGA